MPRGRQVRVGDKAFSKYGDAYEYYKKILHAYPIGGIVVGTDQMDLRDLLHRHSEEAEKTGSGIDHFIVDNGPPEYGRPTRCFWIIRTDGSRIDFSIKNCLEARPQDKDT